MPKRRFRKSGRRGKQVKLPVKKQVAWKKMAGIAASAIDAAGSLPGPVGLVARGLSMVKNLINVEDKMVDLQVSASTDSATGRVDCLTLLAQGTSDITRIGNKVLAKSIDINGFVTPHASSSFGLVRILLVLDKQDGQGTAPTLAQILESTSASTIAHMNKNNSDRFVILGNQTVYMDTGAGYQRLQPFKFYKDLSDLHINYDGANATQANATSNHIYLATISNEPTNAPSVTFDSRFRYYDN